MAMCEDFPACGHEQGCCPRFENGVQTEMVCVCGARLPKNNPVSLCHHCLKDAERQDAYPEDTPMYEDYYGGE